MVMNLDEDEVENVSDESRNQPIAPGSNLTPAILADAARQAKESIRNLALNFEAMDRTGVTQDHLISKLKEELEATEVKVFHNKETGVVQH